MVQKAIQFLMIDINNSLNLSRQTRSLVGINDRLLGLISIEV